MACTVQILHVNIIPGAPNRLRVMGRVTACPGNSITVGSTITATSGPVSVDPATDRFVETLPITASGVNCGDTITVTITCPAAQGQQCPPHSEAVVVQCCDVSIISAQGLVGAGSLTPSAIRVEGQLLGCQGDQVVVSTNVTGQSPATGIDPMTGGFRVILPITASGVKCCDRITVTAWCSQDPNCLRRRDLELDCPGCFRGQVSFTAAASCTGSPPTKDITLNATVHVPPGQQRTFRWDFGDGTTSPLQHTFSNTGTDCNTPFTLPAETHAYAPGAYTARLRLVPPPYECDPDEIPLNLTVQCPAACPTGSITSSVGSGCVSGKRTVTVQATVTAPTAAASGSWHASHPSPNGIWGQPFSVPANTTQDQTSNASLQETFDLPPGTHTISLRFSSHPNCPAITTQVVVPECPYHCDVTVDYLPKPLPCLQAGGSVAVNFTALLVPSNPGYAGPFVWVVKDSSGNVIKSQQQPPPTANPHQFIHTFTSPGTYEVLVSVQTDGTKCKDSNGNPVSIASDSVTVDIESCCPTGKLDAKSLSACQWYFEADVTNPGNAPLTFEWSFHDGTTKQTTSPANYTAHTFAPGSITTGTAQVTVKAAGCPDLVLTAPVTHSCGGCPTIDPVQANVSGTVPGASVTFTTSVNPAAAANSFKWTVRIPNGTVFTKTTTAPTTTDGTGDGPWTNTSTGSTGGLDLGSAGAYSVSVEATGPGVGTNCPQPASTAFTLSGPPDGDGPPPACGILRILLVLLIAMLAVAILGAVCLGWSPWVPIIVGFLLLLVLLLWIFICQPPWCDVLLTLWQSAFGAMMALLYMSACLLAAGCIGWAFWIAGIFFVGFLSWWIVACRPSTCEFLNAFLIAVIDASALLGSILAGASWFNLVFTGLSGCLHAWVPAGLGLLALWITLNMVFFKCAVQPK